MIPGGLGAKVDQSEIDAFASMIGSELGASKKQFLQNIYAGFPAVTPQMMSPPDKSAVEESAEAKTLEKALKVEDFGRNMKLIETNDGQNVHG